MGTVVTIIIAFLTLAVAFLGYRKTHPKREIVYWIRSEAMLSRTMPDLRVLYEEQSVTDPHFVTLYFESTGRADIQKTHFDDDQPLTFELGAPILGEAPQLSGNEINRMELAIAGSSGIALQPTLLSSKFFASAQFITDGPPVASVVSSLVNVRVRSADALDRNFGARWKSLMLVLRATLISLNVATLVGLGYLIANGGLLGISVTGDKPQVYLVLTLLAAFTMAAGAVLISAMGGLLPARPASRLQKRLHALLHEEQLKG